MKINELIEVVIDVVRETLAIYEISVIVNARVIPLTHFIDLDECEIIAEMINEIQRRTGILIPNDYNPFTDDHGINASIAETAIAIYSLQEINVNQSIPIHSLYLRLQPEAILILGENQLKTVSFEFTCRTDTLKSCQGHEMVLSIMTRLEPMEWVKEARSHWKPINDLSFDQCYQIFVPLVVLKV